MMAGPLTLLIGVDNERHFRSPAPLARDKAAGPTTVAHRRIPNAHENIKGSDETFRAQPELARRVNISMHSCLKDLELQ